MAVKTINIKVSTNGPGQSIIVTRDLFVLPPSDNNHIHIPSSQKPFFTVYVPYSHAILKALSREDQIKTFFDKSTFERIMHVNNSTSKPTDPAVIHENATKNIKIMLEILFPTYYPIKNNLHDTFEENIKGDKTKVEEEYHIVPEFITKWISSKHDTFAHLKISGENYTAFEITWVNDVINNATFRKIFTDLFNFKVKLDETIKRNNDEIASETIKFISSYAKVLPELSKNQKVIDDYFTRRGQQYRTQSAGVAARELQELFSKLFAQTNNDKRRQILNSIDQLVNMSADKSLPFELQSYQPFLDLLDLASEIEFKIEITNNYLLKPAAFIKLSSNQRPSKKEKEIYSILQRQYPSLNGLKDLVKPFLSKTSSNPELNNLFTSFKTNPNALFDFATNIQLLIQNKSTNAGFDKDALQLGLITNIEAHKEISSNRRGQSEAIKPTIGSDIPKSYEIEINLNLIKGVLNRETIGKIKCLFGNDLLVDRLNELLEKQHNPNKSNILLSTKKPELLDVGSLKKQASKKQIESVQSKSTHNIRQIPKQTHYTNNMVKQNGGFKIRKTKKLTKSLKTMTGGFVPDIQTHNIHTISPQMLSVKPSKKSKHKTRRRKPYKRW